MYKLYERVPKTAEYMYGSKLIDSEENPFLEGPCLLCISAQHGNKLSSKSNFGVTKEGMKMARLRVRGQKNAGFDVKDFPVKFLSIQLDKNDEDEELTSEKRISIFVNKYLVPLISKDGTKIDYIQAMKNMRNVNLMSYCDGTLLAQSIESNLINKMQELGYTNEESKKIQSQMCIFPISTNRLSAKQKSTCISFKDINDGETNDNVTPEERQAVLESQIGEQFFKYSNNEIAYLFNGDGDHDLKKYAKVGNAMSVCLSSAISKALENSIKNFSNKKFTPITARSTNS